MKHSWKITLMLLSLFLITQLFGLVVINKYMVKRVVKINTPHGVSYSTNVSWHTNAITGEPPKVNENWSFISVFIAILLSTVLVFILVKFKAGNIWNMWYMLAVFLAMSVSLSAFMNVKLALAVSGLLVFLKVKSRNAYFHNLTEPLVYAGISVFLVPLFNMFSISALLILISIYDYVAVFKSKHMVSLAKFQLSSSRFMGLAIPKSGSNLSKISSRVSKHCKVKSNKSDIAILGGGDITFPLIFAGVMLKYFPLWKVLLVPILASISLLLLFTHSQKGKFYPAMPSITAGCLLGYLIALLI